jgi:hypothetical protein
MPERLGPTRIADTYTTLLHVSGASIASTYVDGNATVFDGGGNSTGLTLSTIDDRVIINNYIEPEGWSYQKEWLDAFFPINCVIVTVDYVNPMSRIYGTKWVLQSEGLFPVGAGTGTDKNNDTFTFTAGGNKQRDFLANGDKAGEFRGGISINDLPPHSHTTDTQLELVPEQQAGRGTNVGFIFYFGDTINTDQLQREDGRYLDDDAVEAFEYNTTYKDIPNYRDYIIRESHRSGKVYIDADFDPRFGNQRLEGWAPPQAGGPGWGGILNTSGKFIGNSPRPVNVNWTVGGTNFRLQPSFYDPRVSDRVHPGKFPDEQLIKARDFIIQVLGVKEAAKALAGVNRLKELGQTVEQAYSGDNTYYSRIPQNKIVESSTTGQDVRHNNIPPNRPLYFWRRVPLDFVDNLPPEDRPSPELPFQFIIKSNKKSTKGNVFNLNEWAIGEGWNGQAAVTIIVDEGVYIYSDDPDDDKVPGMIIDTFPGGLTLINKGFIMGRGGNGGSMYTYGQDGGDAIHTTGNSEIIIDNTQGAIGGGGGGGSASKLGHSGGGGGAGGGWGGTAPLFQHPNWDYGDGDGKIITSSEIPANNWSVFPKEDDDPFRPTAAGGRGGAPGELGGNGRWYNNFTSQYSLQLFKAKGDIVTSGWGPSTINLPGVGGEAGGSGAGGRSGGNHQGTGGGGGRILTATAYGGGTGGVPGARFGAIDINGNIRTDGPAWSNTAPANNGSVSVRVIPRPGRSRDKEIETYITAYNSSRPYRGWNSGYRLRSPLGYGNGRYWAVGPHWRADGVNGGTTGLPYIVAGVNKAGTDTHREYGESTSLTYNGFSYLSPTGWDGYNHRSGLIHGGSTNQPGIYEPANARRIIGNQDLWSGIYTARTSAGGGGWGAPGGLAWKGGRTWRPEMDTRGSGPMLRLPGQGGLTVKAIAGSVTIIGGLVYGETEGNVNIR